MKLRPEERDFIIRTLIQNDLEDIASPAIALADAWRYGIKGYEEFEDAELLNLLAEQWDMTKDEALEEINREIQKENEG